MNTNAICDNVAVKHKASKVLIRKLYRAYWLFVKEKINQMEFGKHISEEEFRKSKYSITIPHIGRLACTWKMYNEIRDDINHIKEIRKGEQNESEESETII